MTITHDEIGPHCVGTPPAPHPKHFQTCSTWTSLRRDHPSIQGVPPSSDIWWILNNNNNNTLFLRMYSWQAGGSHPIEMLSCHNITVAFQ